MRYTKSLLPTLALIARALSIDITSNTITRGNINTELGDSSIAEGVYWSIIDNDFTNFVGSLDVQGELFISSADPLIGLNVNLGGAGNTWTTGPNGRVVLNSEASTLTPYYNAYAGTFLNDGEIWFAGNGDVGIPTMSISSSDFTNNGLMHFTQLTRSAGYVSLGYDLMSITNDGAICLVKMAYHQTTDIEGSGCFDIGDESTVYFVNSLQTISTDQNFVFTSSNGAIKVASLTTPQTFNVVGWGDDNVIGLGTPIDSWSYSEDGILTVRANLASVYYFDIGPGYDSSLIEVVDTNYGPGIAEVLNGGLKYNGAPVNTERPASCPLCLPVPQYPDDGSSSIVSSSVASSSSEVASSSAVSSAASSSEAASSSAASSSEAASSSAASSSEAASSSAASSSEAASSSAAASSSDACPECTDYTTTFVTTNSDGSVSTGTGEVIVTTNSDGELTTSTDIIGDCPECTDYTTTFVTTLPDGSVSTGTGEVIVTTNSDGDLYTTTDIIGDCPECTDYTTEFTSTASNGAVITGAEEIIVTTDANGDLVTHTSLLGEGTLYDGKSTVTDVVGTTVVTITSCSNDVCTEVPVTTGLTTVSDEVTTYTTYCPLSDDEKSTTVITITSCSNDVCTKVPVTTGLTVISDDVTTYTTYCPLSDETVPTTLAVASTDSYTTVTSDYTTYVTLASTVAAGSDDSAETVAAESISTYEGAAGVLSKPFSFFVTAFLALGVFM